MGEGRKRKVGKEEKVGEGRKRNVFSKTRGKKREVGVNSLCKMGGERKREVGEGRKRKALPKTEKMLTKLAFHGILTDVVLERILRRVLTRGNVGVLERGRLLSRIRSNQDNAPNPCSLRVKVKTVT